MSRRSRLRLSLSLVATIAATAARAAVVEETTRVPVSVVAADGRRVEHDVVVTILRADDRPRAPLLVLSHGRGPDRETMRPIVRSARPG